MEAKVTYCGGMRFVGQADSGHAVVMDTGAAHGGGESAARPNELLLLGLAGCTGMDVISILRKKRQAVTALEIVVRAEKAAGHPGRFTSFKVEYVVRGENVDPEAVRRAIELSEGTYCSVGATLREPATVSSSFRVLPAGD
jgi:putative redox protein